MKRRQALKYLGTGLSASAVLPWLSSCSDNAFTPEINYAGVVGIIGAGAAGLQAADLLRSKGVKVKLFEASNRIGGRVRSIRSFDGLQLIADFPVELGADRLIGTNSVLGDLIRKIQVSTVDFRSVTEDHFILDEVLQSATTLNADADFNAFQNFITSILPGYTGNETVATAASLNGRVAEVLDAWTQINYGTSNTRASAKAIAENLSLITHDQKEYFLRSNPMEDVLGFQFSRVIGNIDFNRAIKSVDYNGDQIQLTDLNNESVLVDKLIIAVPLSKLKDNSIQFNPTLPTIKSNALNNLAMDAAIRIILEFKQNFWGNDKTMMLGGSICPVYVNAGTGRSDLNRTMSLTIYGEKAEYLSSLTDEEKIDLIINELDNVFGENAATLNLRKDAEGNRQYLVHDWSKQEFIKGGYSYILSGGSIADRESLATSVDDKIFFAGEATDYSGNAGTISGALKSGERAALEVAAVITSTV